MKKICTQLQSITNCNFIEVSPQNEWSAIHISSILSSLSVVTSPFQLLSCFWSDRVIWDMPKPSLLGFYLPIQSMIQTKKLTAKYRQMCVVCDKLGRGVHLSLEYFPMIDDRAGYPFRIEPPPLSTPHSSKNETAPQFPPQTVQPDHRSHQVNRRPKESLMIWSHTYTHTIYLAYKVFGWVPLAFYWFIIATCNIVLAPQNTIAAIIYISVKCKTDQQSAIDWHGWNRLYSSPMMCLMCCKYNHRPFSGAKVMFFIMDDLFWDFAERVCFGTSQDRERIIEKLLHRR